MIVTMNAGERGLVVPVGADMWEVRTRGPAPYQQIDTDTHFFILPPTVNPDTPGWIDHKVGTEFVEVGQFGLSFLATDTGFRVHQTGEQFSATIVGELVFGNRT